MSNPTTNLTDGGFDPEPTLERLRQRRGIKWAKYGPDRRAAWVADMDFDPPPVVVDAIRRRLDDGDLGYATDADTLIEVWERRNGERYGWYPDAAHARPFTSALHALEFALWNATAPGDGVVVFTPIYFPFLDAIRASGRRVVDVPLDPAGWRIDHDRLDASIDPGTTALLLCHPHNPTGRMFSEAELASVATVADRHDLLVVSDEVWGDLVLDAPTAFRPAASTDDRFAGRTVTLAAASKAFNLAGLRCAVAHVDHSGLRETLSTMPGHLHGAPSTLGIVGTIAAWTRGDDWLAAAQRTLLARRQHLTERLRSDLPTVAWTPPDATYLAWLDFRDTGLGDDPADQLIDRVGVALSSGPPFGDGGIGHARLNFATSTAMLDDILDRIGSVVR